MVDWGRVLVLWEVAVAVEQGDAYSEADWLEGVGVLVEQNVVPES